MQCMTRLGPPSQRARRLVAAALLHPACVQSPSDCAYGCYDERYDIVPLETILDAAWPACTPSPTPGDLHVAERCLSHVCLYEDRREVEARLGAPGWCTTDHTSNTCMWPEEHLRLTFAKSASDSGIAPLQTVHRIQVLATETNTTPGGLGMGSSLRCATDAWGLPDTALQVIDAVGSASYHAFGFSYDRTRLWVWDAPLGVADPTGTEPLDERVGGLSLEVVE